MKFTKLNFLAALVAAGTSAKAMSILTPSSQWWWQTGDQALLEWDCSDKTHDKFGISVINSNQQLLPGGIMNLVVMQDNTQCNINIVPTLNVGTDYNIIFHNPVNATDVWAKSEAFEVKGKGSPYPTIPTPSIPGNGGNGGANTASASASSATHTGAGVAQASFTLGGALAVIGSVVAVLGA